MKLVDTRTIETYRLRCPHCRTTVENTKEATVAITKSKTGEILDIVLGCDWANTNQDRDRT